MPTDSEARATRRAQRAALDADLKRADDALAAWALAHAVTPRRLGCLACVARGARRSCRACWTLGTYGTRGPIFDHREAFALSGRTAVLVSRPYADASHVPEAEEVAARFGVTLVWHPKEISTYAHGTVHFEFWNRDAFEWHSIKRKGSTWARRTWERQLKQYGGTPRRRATS